MTDKATLQVAIDCLLCLLEHLPLEIEGVYTSQDVFAVLLKGGRIVYRKLFELKTMLDFLCHVVERHFPPIIAVYLHAPQ